MSAADDLLPESVRRAETRDAEESAENARLRRIHDAWDAVRGFLESDAQTDFSKEWAGRLVALGEILEAEGLAQHLDQIKSDSGDELRQDAFAYSIEIFRLAVAQDSEAVARHLTAANHAAGARGEFCAVVNEAIRRGIMGKLLKIEFPATQPASAVENEPPKSDARHSADFASVHWFGTDYTFKPTQAACIKFLWKAWENGTPVVGQDAILESADSKQQSLLRVFRHHPAWKVMIVSPLKGRYCLKKPE